MTEHQDQQAERTRICGRPVEAFNEHGDTTTVIDLQCDRLGPPARPVSWPGTSFVATLQYTEPSADSDTIGTERPAPVVTSREADSMWNALLAARTELDTHGWYLPIAAARTDSWCVYAERRPEVGVVHRIGDMFVHEGILTPAPRTAVSTVAAQRQAYPHLQWRESQPTPQETRS
jgi:hypothetical protein